MGDNCRYRFPEYTGIAYPFQKRDIVAVPDFQFVGMERAGMAPSGCDGSVLPWRLFMQTGSALLAFP